MCGIAQQRILDHALGHAQSHISWSCVQIAFRILHGFPGFQWIFHGFAPSLWCTFDTFTNFYSVASYNSHLRIRLGNCTIADQSFGIDMLDSFGSSSSGREKCCEKCCPASPAYRTDAVLGCVSSLPLFVFALRFFDTVCPSATSVLGCFSSPPLLPFFLLQFVDTTCSFVLCPTVVP